MGGDKEGTSCGSGAVGRGRACSGQGASGSWGCGRHNLAKEGPQAKGTRRSSREGIRDLGGKKEQALRGSPRAVTVLPVGASAGP